MVNQNVDEMHPIQTVAKIKMGTLAIHRSKKPYVHAIMKNEALLDAEMEWGRMTPSAENFVGKKRGVNARGQVEKKRRGNELAAICLA